MTVASSHSTYGSGASGKLGCKPLEDVELARHVVRARRDGPERRPPQDGLPVARAQQIGQVGVPGRELLDLQLARIET